MKNAWVEVDLNVLRENVRKAMAALRPGTELIFVVKSNAYGHGMRPVARAARECGVRWFAVGDMEEAVELRDALPDARILVLGVVASRPDVLSAIRHNITVLLVSEQQASALASEVGMSGSGQESSLVCHAKIDTGMARLGFAWENAAQALEPVASRTGLKLEGICTHFACADKEDESFTRLQAQRFCAAVRACRERGIAVPFRHAANSSAFLRNQTWDFDAVRLGILLYGYGLSGRRQRCATRPFLQWKARVLQVKKVPAGSPIGYDATYVTPAPTHIATVSVGYADGYFRTLSNKSRVLIGGEARPVVGRVSMNYLTADVGPRGNVREGDDVVLLGEQGGQAIWADQLAEWAGTISYEVLTGIRNQLSWKGMQCTADGKSS